MGSPTPINTSIHPIILFDGVCNLCNGAVQFVITHDPKEIFRFASLQSEFASDLLKSLNLTPPPTESVLLIENGKIYSQSDAVLRVVARLHGPSKNLRILSFLPKWIRDGLYRFIARNRYRLFGKRNSCMIPTPELGSRFF